MEAALQGPGELLDACASVSNKLPKSRMPSPAAYLHRDEVGRVVPVTPTAPTGLANGWAMTREARDERLKRATTSAPISSTPIKHNSGLRRVHRLVGRRRLDGELLAGPSSLVFVVAPGV